MFNLILQATFTRVDDHLYSQNQLSWEVMCVISHVPEFSMSSQTDLLPDEDLPAYQLSIIHSSVCVWENQDTLCSVSCQAVQSMMCIKMRLLWILVHVWDQSWFYSKTTLSIYRNRTGEHKTSCWFPELSDTMSGKSNCVFILLLLIV